MPTTSTHRAARTYPMPFIFRIVRIVRKVPTMRAYLGAALLLGGVGGVVWALYRITTDALDWFYFSGAGNVLGWAAVIALVASFAAVPVGAWGIAARLWVVRLERGQRLESTVQVLQSQPAARQLATSDAPRLSE